MPPKKKVANGYKFAEPLPNGIILQDNVKKKWRLGPSIGKGGFGEIYSAQEESSKSQSYPYVIKIEPHANGPLFVEINFYLRHAKPASIEDFKKEKGLKTFGMPAYYGSGSICYNDEKYRFLVMDKFSIDLYKLYLDNNKVFPTDTVFKLGLQLVDVLEYIHQRGYVHADIKAANILLGATKETLNKQVYLVDFGLASKFTMDKEFKPNPKRAHDGTIEFLSRDAHQGVQTRRGDLEILAYNLIQWLGCKLPWESNLSDPKVVHSSKEDHMTTVPKMIKASFGSKTAPEAIVEFLKYIKTLKFNTEPDYKKIRNIFTSGIQKGERSIGTQLQFSLAKTPLKRNLTPLPSSRSKKTRSNKVEENSDVSGNEDKPLNRERVKRDFKSKKDEVNGNVSEDKDETPKPKKRGKPKKEFIMADEDNDVVMDTPDDSTDHEADNSFVTIRKKNRTKRIQSLDILNNDDDLEGYNDAMKEIKIKINSDMPAKRKRTQPNAGNKKNTPNKDEDHSEMSDDVNETIKPKRRGRSKKDLIVANENSDVELASTDNTDDERNHSFSPAKKETKSKSTIRKNGLNRKISKSLDDLSNKHQFDGFTDAMKEVMLKKLKTGGRKKRVIPNQAPTNESDGAMIGFTEEMKAIALKKKSKEKTGKKTTPAVPIATTSKASDKRGLVKPNSRRLQKVLPITHGEVLRFSDGSVSD